MCVMLKVYIVKGIIRVELMIPFLYKHFCNEVYYLKSRRKGISYIE